MYYPKLSEDLLAHAALVAQVRLAAGRRKDGGGAIRRGTPYAFYWISLHHLVAPSPPPIPGRALPTRYPGPKAVVGRRASRPLRQEVP